LPCPRRALTDSSDRKPTRKKSSSTKMIPRR
jgi:hypothetical protein